MLTTEAIDTNVNAGVYVFVCVVLPCMPCVGDTQVLVFLV